MTIDEIIRIAKEADLWGEIYAMQRFAELVAAAERDACAKLCQESDRYRGDYFASIIKGNQ